MGTYEKEVLVSSVTYFETDHVRFEESSAVALKISLSSTLRAILMVVSWKMILKCFILLPRMTQIESNRSCVLGQKDCGGSRATVCGQGLSSTIDGCLACRFSGPSCAVFELSCRVLYIPCTSYRNIDFFHFTSSETHKRCIHLWACRCYCSFMQSKR